MAECKWNKDEICVNADCPMVADYCPVPDYPGVCRHEDRAPEESAAGMPEEQVIKALEGLTYGSYNCLNCKYKITRGENRCSFSRCVIAQSALDLIKSKNAKISEKNKLLNKAGVRIKVLEEAKDQLVKDVFNAEMNLDHVSQEKENLIRTYGQCMVEAIKEFAERLCKDRVSNDPVVIAVKSGLKEMEGYHG